MSDTSITNEVTQQFLRRTPVKLRQFSRLLNDLSNQKIDPLRLKALISQVNKTHEACATLGFDSTAKLLNKLLKQLAIKEEALESQRPLLKRFAKRLSQHSETLELGSNKKVQEQPKSEAEPQTASSEQKQAVAAKEQKNQAEKQNSKSPKVEKQQTKVNQESVKEIDAIKGIKDVPKDEQYEAQNNILEVEADNLAKQSIAELESASDEVDPELEKYALYLTGSIIVFVSKDKDSYNTMGKQFESLGVEVFHADDLEKAKVYSKNNPGCVIVASIEFAQSNEKLADDVEEERTPLIYFSEKDTQEDRLLALRSGGTGFLVEPVTLTSLLELIEKQYDIHAESPYRILVMEDSKAQAKYYEKVLSKGHFDTRVVNNPEVLLEALRGFDPEVVLMDMQMPGCSGIELTRIIRQMSCYDLLPIIFLSAEENENKQNQALSSGGTDFIVKPVQKSQLMFNAELYARRHRILRPQIGINSDTSLPYAPYFKQHVSIEAIRMTRGGGNAALAIIQLDGIDNLIANANFLLVNLAIQQLAALLKKRLRKTDIIGHVETGQLGIILTSGNKSNWMHVMQQIKQQFSSLSFQSSQEDILSISIGISLLPINADAHQWFSTTYNCLSEAFNKGGNIVQSCKMLSDT